MTASTVTLNQLESHLWEAANILRGPVDAADFKTYVFPLLFFKRLSDVHDEEYQTALEESGGDEVWTKDPYGRNFAGMPPSKSGDYAWVQHMLRSMAPKTGLMAVVLPHGALFRMGAEGKIRRKILGMDLLEAVIGLGSNLFYGTGLAACILVFRQRKAQDRQNKVLILNTSKQFKTGRAQNELLPEHIERIHGWYRDYQDVAGISHVVTLEEIAANDYNLNIPRYVEPTVDQDVLTVEEAMQRLKVSIEAAFSAEEKLIALLERDGLLL
jgi:type I restriction enzyme M protein